MLRFIGDLTALKQWVSLGLARLVVAGITTLITLEILAVVNMTLAFVVTAALAAGAAARYSMGGLLQKMVREARRRHARLAANVSEKITALAVVQVFGQSQREKERIQRQSSQLMSAMEDRARAIRLFFGIIELTTALASGMHSWQVQHWSVPPASPRALLWQQ